MSLLTTDPTQLIVLAGSEEPQTTCTFTDNNGQVIQLATGYTFTVKVFDSTGTKLTKTTGIAGSNSSPNVFITWAPGELAITPGNYTLQLTANNTASNRDRIFQIGLGIRASA